jgi:outer membrane protein TolC
MPLLLLTLLAGAPGPLPPELTLAQAQQLALERHPGLAAVAQRVEAMHRQAEADGALPSPEFMAEAWQVPLTQPWSLVDAQMLSLNFKQTFPGWGVRGAKAEAKARTADVEAVRRSALELEVRREVGHAFVDLREALDKHATHARHEAVAGRLVEVAQARVSSGGRLEEVLLAQRDRARLAADVSAEVTAIASAREPCSAWPMTSPSLPSLLAPSRRSMRAQRWAHWSSWLRRIGLSCSKPPHAAPPRSLPWAPPAPRQPRPVSRSRSVTMRPRG